MRKITTEIMEYGYAFLYERYRLPLYVTECGLSCNDHIFLDGQVHDADRIDFLFPDRGVRQKNIIIVPGDLLAFAVTKNQPKLTVPVDSSWKFQANRLFIFRKRNGFRDSK